MMRIPQPINNVYRRILFDYKEEREEDLSGEGFDCVIREGASSS